MVCSEEAYGQTGKFTDSRDGTEYETVVIGNRMWFQENLKLETEMSHCPNFNKKSGDCDNGNYYSYKELKTLCPKGWRTARVKDLEDYINHLIGEDAAKRDSLIHIDTLSQWADMVDDTIHHTPPSSYATVMIQINSESFDLFGGNTLLNMENLGWVEGRKVRRKWGSFTLWMSHEELDNPRYHVHIGANNYVKHIHKHNIDDKPSKTRKFGVRCVCDVE
ncbi:MAG: FISUMP domain-containing protein [Chitinophagales bacterium]